MKTSLSTSQISRQNFLRTLILGAAAASAVKLAAQPDATPVPSDLDFALGDLRAFVELARSDIRAEKALIISENIPFTDDEAVEFWPLHREYDLELNKLLDRRLALIRQFARTYGTMSDDEAEDLAKNAFNLEEKRTDLKRKYFKKFIKVIPAVKAARFFQIENQINMALDLQVAASLPLIK